MSVGSTELDAKKRRLSGRRGKLATRRQRGWNAWRPQAVPQTADCVEPDTVTTSPPERFGGPPDAEHFFFLNQCIAQAVFSSNEPSLILDAAIERLPASNFTFTIQ
ncbi:hypothetical protein [Burkholderia sp. AU28863]|uniref:hypothetical protein n=1 Tax=Burkholderia sp. AU28863 TaxID=2015352 RepID=UPI00117883DF|nr:hypothetical protein [Burkholderia sp. AU28863]